MQREEWSQVGRGVKGERGKEVTCTRSQEQSRRENIGCEIEDERVGEKQRKMKQRNVWT